MRVIVEYPDDAFADAEVAVTATAAALSLHKATERAFVTTAD